MTYAAFWLMAPINEFEMPEVFKFGINCFEPIMLRLYIESPRFVLDIH